MNELPYLIGEPFNGLQYESANADIFMKPFLSRENRRRRILSKRLSRSSARSGMVAAWRLSLKDRPYRNGAVRISRQRP